MLYLILLILAVAATTVWFLLKPSRGSFVTAIIFWVLGFIWVINHFWWVIFLGVAGVLAYIYFKRPSVIDDSKGYVQDVVTKIRGE